MSQSNKKIILDDPKAVEYLTKKGEEIMIGRDLTKQIEKLEEERAKCGMLAQKFQDKLIPIVEKALKGKMEEFEEATTIEKKDGKIVITIINIVDEFKERYLTKKNKK